MSGIREVVITGSGPAGYTAALYTARAQLKPLLFGSSVFRCGSVPEAAQRARERNRSKPDSSSCRPPAFLNRTWWSCGHFDQRDRMTGTAIGTVHGYDGTPLRAPELPSTPLKPRGRTR